MPGKACVFVDGENLRYAIIALFPNEFDKHEYLPRNARWDSWFDAIVESLAGTYERFRAYWYVAGALECFPYRLPKDEDRLKRFLSKQQIEQNLDLLQGQELQERMAEIVLEIKDSERKMRSRFDGWQVVQNAISTKQNSIEFRTAGYLTYNAFTKALRGEKAVDVNLAIDLVMLRDIYNIAVIVSGDGDYIPAVQAAKDAGKKVVNVSFLTRQGKRLPGGAPRLNRLCDYSLDIQCEDIAPFLHLKLREERKLI